MTSAPGVHHFTVDVEEYFHPTALSSHYPISGWDGLPRRCPAVVLRLLDFLRERRVLGTFFVLGWVAEKEPDLVRAIAGGGHEIASHGFEHELVARLGPRGFRSSVQRSKQVLEDLTNAPVLGYRAPSFSIVPGIEWAFDILIESGYRYDASLFPIARHPAYGYPEAGRDPFVIERAGGTLIEFPATTLDLLSARLPASGGAYFRLLPYALVRAGMRQAEGRGAPGMFYIHPWELDDWAPDVAAPWLQRVRTFAGRGRTWPRLERLLTDFRFQRVDQSLEQMQRRLKSRP